jgi:hypothetical protein
MFQDGEAETFPRFLSGNEIDLVEALRHNEFIISG